MKTASPVRDWIITILVAVVLACLLKFFIVDSCKILSESMATTLNTGERLLLSRISYVFGDPQRGDIIVFDPPAEMDEGKDFIKRVIALPGETVEVKAGEGVYINGELLPEDFVREIPLYNFGPVTVPEEGLFVLGDNRNYSADSHYWSYPFITFDDVNGKVFLRYWPLNTIGIIKNPFK